MAEEAKEGAAGSRTVAAADDEGSPLPKVTDDEPTSIKVGTRESMLEAAALGAKAADVDARAIGAAPGAIEMRRRGACCWAFM